MRESVVEILVLDRDHVETSARDNATPNICGNQGVTIKFEPPRPDEEEFSFKRASLDLTKIVVVA